MTLSDRLSQQAMQLGEWSHWASFDWEHRFPLYFQQLNVHLASLGRPPAYWHNVFPVYSHVAYPASNLDGTAPPIIHTPVSDGSSLSRDQSTVSDNSTSCYSSTSINTSPRCKFNCGLIVEIHELPDFCKRKNAWQRVKDLLRNALLATGTKRDSPGMVHMKYEPRLSSQGDRKVYAQWSPKSRKEAYNVCSLLGGNEWDDTKLIVSIRNCHHGIHEVEYEWREPTSSHHQLLNLRTLEECRRRRVTPRATKVEIVGRGSSDEDIRAVAELKDDDDDDNSRSSECSGRQQPCSKADKESEGGEMSGMENGDCAQSGGGGGGGGGGGEKKVYAGPTILRPCEKTRDLLFKE